MPELFGKCEGCRRFRIGIAHRREVRIRILLLFDNMEIRKAPVRHHSPEGNGAGAVQRGVYDGNIQSQVLCAVDRKGFDGVQIASVILFAQHDDAAVRQSLLVASVVEITEIIQAADLFHHTVGDGRAHLTAVLPVGLVSVIFLRVVGSGDVDAGNRSQLPDGPGKLGRRPEIRKYVDFDPRFCQNTGGKTGKLFRKMSWIMCDDDAFFHGLFAVFADKGCNTAGGASHRIIVHPGGSRSYNAAKPCRSERHVRFKAFAKFFVVLSDLKKLLMKRIRNRYIFEPVFIFFSVIHGNTSLRQIFRVVTALYHIPLQIPTNSDAYAELFRNFKR